MMNGFNHVTSWIFDRLLAPFGHGPAGFDLVVWSVGAGIIALIVYRYASNQKGIERAKDRVKLYLYEVRLFRHDMAQVFLSTGKILGHNAIYVGHNLAPMAVMIVPMMTVLFQLEANYAFDPAEVGDVELLRVELDDERPDVAVTDVELILPAGIALEAPPVRTADREIYWRLRADQAGDHVLTLRAGDETLTKGWAVGGEPRKVPVMRTRSWNGYLYPGEAGIPSGSAFYSLAIAYPTRQLPWLPDGELGILVLYFGLSLVAGFALKDLFGVTL